MRFQILVFLCICFVSNAAGESPCQKEKGERDGFLIECNGENGLYAWKRCLADPKKKEKPCQCIDPNSGDHYIKPVYADDNCKPGPGDTPCTHKKKILKRQDRQDDAQCDSNGQFYPRQRYLEDDKYNHRCVNTSTGVRISANVASDYPCKESSPSTTAKPSSTTAKPSSTTAKPSSTTAKPSSTTSQPSSTSAKPSTTATPDPGPRPKPSPKPTPKPNMKACEKKKHEMQKKGIASWRMPDCDKNGYFSAVQCKVPRKPRMKKQCYCVTKHGIIMKSIQGKSRQSWQSCKRARRKGDMFSRKRYTFYRDFSRWFYKKFSYFTKNKKGFRFYYKFYRRFFYYVYFKKNGGAAGDKDVNYFNSMNNYNSNKFNSDFSSWFNKNFQKRSDKGYKFFFRFYQMFFRRVFDKTNEGETDARYFDFTKKYDKNKFYQDFQKWADKDFPDYRRNNKNGYNFFSQFFDTFFKQLFDESGSNEDQGDDYFASIEDGDNKDQEYFDFIDKKIPINGDKSESKNDYEMVDGDSENNNRRRFFYRFFRSIFHRINNNDYEDFYDFFFRDDEDYEENDEEYEGNDEEYEGNDEEYEGNDEEYEGNDEEYEENDEEYEENDKEYEENDEEYEENDEEYEEKDEEYEEKDEEYEGIDEENDEEYEGIDEENDEEYEGIDEENDEEYEEKDEYNSNEEYQSLIQCFIKLMKLLDR